MRAAARAAILLAALLAGVAGIPPRAGAAPYTTYLWHLHQPLYWPAKSTWEGDRLERAYETITLGHSESDVASIFALPDRVAAYQSAPRDAVDSIRDLPYAGAQISFAGALIENVSSLGDAAWSGGLYAANWYAPVREAMGWTDAGGKRRMDPVLVGAHHAIAPLLDERAFRMELAVGRQAWTAAWGAAPATSGFFPAEMCFSERLIPALVDAGVTWALVPDIHIARACADYPAQAALDNCDPPNLADLRNPAEGFYYAQTISRGVTTRVPPSAFRPRRAEYVDPATGVVSALTVVPVAMAMSWNEGYGLYGTGEITPLLPYEDPAHPFLIVFAHDGDNAWSGGHSYYYENVTQFAHAADANGWTPATVERYLADHPVDPGDVVHVEDGGWVNADGDFGSPQFINWNWPLFDASGQFDPENGWAEDERNWAVLTAAQNRVETAEDLLGAADPARVWDPTAAGATDVEKAWHFLLAGYESGYMYYGTSLDFEVKATLACNQATDYADPHIAPGPEPTPPTVWLPQRLPWNPGGFGAGALWGYPSGAGAPMPRDFHVWTFVHDVSGVASVELKLREDVDGIPGADNDTYAGGAGVGAWQTWPMNQRALPAGDPYANPDLDFSVLPDWIADHYWAEVVGFENALLDYYVEAVDAHGNVKRSPIQHVWVGDGNGGGTGGDRVSWTPPAPSAGDTLTITYDLGAGLLPPATDPVILHAGHSGWLGVTDLPMTANGDGTWSADYAIPGSATSVDFVFTDGAGAWDNNGGADWHVPVAGGAAGFTMDGALDASAQTVAVSGAYSLSAAWDGNELYVATQPVGQSVNRDHFVFACASTTGMTAAPWAKAGQVAGSGWFLGSEDANAWNGWFGHGGIADPGGAARSASGGVLEGAIDLVALTGGSLPDTVWLAVGQWASPDGGELQEQVPAGDADGDLEAIELFPFPLSIAPVASPLPDASPDASAAAADAALSLGAGPNPFRTVAHAIVRVPHAGALTVDVIDVAGRRVATLHDGPAPAGDLALTWNGRARNGRQAAPGVYWIRARQDGVAAAKRIVRR